jgi:glycerophosphoryl diester phosphodiesterase
LVPDLKTTVITGFWGKGDEEPNAPLSASFGAPLRSDSVDGLPVFLSGGHHGASTIQDYGVSENSIPAMRMTELLGAQFAEVDTRRTKDGAVVLMHDDELSPRLVQGRFCKGYVSDLTLAELRANCRLENGEEIPTLTEALTIAFDKTRLLGIWLDAKTSEVLAPEIPIAAEFTRMGVARRAAGGLPFVVVNGMFEEELVSTYVGLMHPEGTACLVEYDPDAALNAGCEYWAPRFTLGPQADVVATAQANGLRVIYWTVNGTNVIDKFLTVGQPNGMISDTPGLVYYKYHIGDFTPRGRPKGP